MLPPMITLLAQALDEDPSVDWSTQIDTLWMTRATTSVVSPAQSMIRSPAARQFGALLFPLPARMYGAVGLYDPEFIYGEDWEYWIRISKYYRMKHIPQAVYRYRLHQGSMTAN